TNSDPDEQQAVVAHSDLDAELFFGIKERGHLATDQLHQRRFVQFDAGIASPDRWRVVGVEGTEQGENEDGSYETRANPEQQQEQPPHAGHDALAGPLLQRLTDFCRDGSKTPCRCGPALANWWSGG